MPDGLTDQYITKLTIGYGAHAPRHGPVEDGPGRVIESQLALTVNGAKSNIAIVCCGPAINPTLVLPHLIKVYTAAHPRSGFSPWAQTE